MPKEKELICLFFMVGSELGECCVGGDISALDELILGDGFDMFYDGNNSHCITTCSLFVPPRFFSPLTVLPFHNRLFAFS